MAKVKRKIRVSTARTLRNLIKGNKGKGTTSLHDPKAVRKAVERMAMEDGTPLTFKDHNKNVHIGLDKDKPLYRCPKCQEGVIEREGKTWSRCKPGKNGCTFKPDPEEEFFEEDIAGYQALKIDGRIVRYGYIELPKRHIIDTIWKKILLPVLEGEHVVADEDLVESICDDFETDGMPNRFEVETAVKEDEDESDEDGAGGEEDKILDDPPSDVEMPKEDGPAAVLKGV